MEAVGCIWLLSKFIISSHSRESRLCGTSSQMQTNCMMMWSYRDWNSSQFFFSFHLPTTHNLSISSLPICTVCFEVRLSMFLVTTSSIFSSCTLMEDCPDTHLTSIQSSCSLLKYFTLGSMFQDTIKGCITLLQYSTGNAQVRPLSFTINMLIHQSC
jgi:hypothetical protein